MFIHIGVKHIYNYNNYNISIRNESKDSGSHLQIVEVFDGLDVANEEVWVDFNRCGRL